MYTIHGKAGERFGSEDSKKYRKMAAHGASPHRGGLGIARNEEDYRQLSRRCGRYRRMRGVSLETLKEEKARVGRQWKFITWGEVREQVLEKRLGAGYTSEEQRKYREEKGEKQRGGKDSEKGKQAKRGRTKEARREILRKREEDY